MPDQQEVLRSIYGAYRLARLDQSGFGYFNLSFEGFWRSFFAAVIVAPGYVVLLLQRQGGELEQIGLGRLLMVEGVAYVAAWALFPVMALVLTQAFGLTRYYTVLIIALNWAAVIQIAVFLAVLLVTVILPFAPAGLLFTAITGAILFYQWFVTRAALQTTGGVALAVVLLDLLLNAMVSLSAERLL